MTWALIGLVIASSLVGCAAPTRQTAHGDALPRDPQRFPDRAYQREIDAQERARAWSVRDFVQPRGLL
jgi:hypothetical protein